MFKSSTGAAFLCAGLMLHGSANAANDLARRPTASQHVAAEKGDETCGSQVIAQFLGGMAVPSVRTAVMKAVGHERIRWVKPGTTITQDYQPDRLNVILDDRGRIMTMRCG